MDKMFLDLFTFFAGIIFSVLTFLFVEPVYFGFMLLFSVMFIVDSFIFFMKSRVLSGSMAPVGGVYAGKDNRFNK